MDLDLFRSWYKTLGANFLLVPTRLEGVKTIPLSSFGRVQRSPSLLCLTSVSQRVYRYMENCSVSPLLTIRPACNLGACRFVPPDFAACVLSIGTVGQLSGLNCDFLPILPAVYSPSTARLFIQNVRQLFFPLRCF